MSEVVFKCRWCPCVFSSQLDLDLHLKAFGDNISHFGARRCVLVLLEVECEINRGGFSVDDWHWSARRSLSANTVRACRSRLCLL